MLKKMVSTIMVLMAVIVGSQLILAQNTEAKEVQDTYAYSENGVDYYVCAVDYSQHIVGANMLVFLKGVKDGEKVPGRHYDFMIFRTVSYKIYNDNDRMPIEVGDDIRQSKTAKLVFDLGRACYNK